MSIVVGTASWTDRSLIESGWYPAGVSSPEERLHHYASRFSLVEVDSTYYFLPPRANAVRWVERTPDDFTFDVKAFSLLTQHPARRRAMPPDLDLPPDKPRIYLRHLSPHDLDEVWARFVDGLRPLHEAGKLGAVLFQYAPWFTCKRANEEYLVECCERAAPLRVCVEFRHQSWMDEQHRDETLSFLAEHRIPYVCVDEPQGSRHSVPPVVAATAPDLAVIRLHGRARAAGGRPGPQSAAYRYRRPELERWVDHARHLAQQVDRVHVVFRNAYRDHAVRDAARFQRLLDGTGPGSARSGMA